MLMMLNEEKQPVDVSKQPIVFLVVVSSFIFLLLLLFYSDVLKTIILFYLFSLSICEDK